MTSSECPWCSPVRSGRTVRRGGEDRSWFGRPQAIKKAAGNAAIKGRMRRTCWRPSTTTLFKPSVVPWKPFTNCQKKERSLSAPLFDACPLTEGNRAMVMGRTPTGRRHYDQTTPEVSKPREGRVPCPSRSTHRPHSPKRGASIRSLRYKPFRYQQKHPSMKNPWVP